MAGQSRTWPKEPWTLETRTVDTANMGKLEVYSISGATGSKIFETGQRGQAERVVTAVNSMRGWSAPDRAVKQLWQDLVNLVEDIEDSAQSEPFVSGTAESTAAVEVLRDVASRLGDIWRKAGFQMVNEPREEAP